MSTRVRSFLCAALILAVAVPAAAQIQPRQTLPTGLISQIALPGGVVTDSRSVNVAVTLTNRTDQTQSGLTRRTPFAPHWDAPAFSVTRDGRELPYHGRMVKFGPPRAEDYMILAPGESRTVTVNLGEVYDFGLAGAYRVRLDTGVLGTATALPLSQIGQDRGWGGRLASNEIGVAVEARAVRGFVSPSALESAGGWEVTAGGVVYSGCGVVEQTQVDAALTKACDEATFATNIAAASLGTPTPWYVTWYGAYDLTRATTVLGNWGNIGNALCGTKPDTIVCHGADCSAGDFAYTYPVDHPNTIYLCDGFWSAGSLGWDSRPGTIIHEMSHLKAGTQDHAYGRDACKTLATNDPASAIENADSYEYFAEDLNNKTKSPALPEGGPAVLFVLLAAAGGVVLIRSRAPGRRAA